MTDPNQWLKGTVADKRVLRLLRAGKSLGPTPGAIERGWAEFVVLTGFVPPDGSGGDTSGAGPSGAAGGGTAGTAGAGATGTGAATAKIGFTTSAIVKALGLGAALGVGASVGLTLVNRASSVPSGAPPSPAFVVAAPTPTALEIVRAAPSPAIERAVEGQLPLAARASSAVGAHQPSPTLQPAERPAPSIGSLAPESTVGSFPMERETPQPLAARASSAAGAQATSVGSFPAESALQANSLKLEAADVAQVRALLGSGRAGEALKLLAASSGRFPGGPLAQEREALTVEALVLSGQTDAAREHAGSFEAKHPMSPLLARVRSLVAP